MTSSSYATHHLTRTKVNSFQDREKRGFLWISLLFLGIPWYTLVYPGIPWYTQGVLVNTADTLEDPDIP